ncbi:MAG: UDP-glucose 4-epimerase GalE [Oscillospiraceae bacterium]|nr:UDP-glucose 4-epimerase GalE [Oscillospiraceae bacterium]
MSVLLTGGAGFIGSHTAAELAAAGEQIVIVDDFSNSDRFVAAQLEKLTGQTFRCYAADAADKAAMESVFSENEIDAVIHFAGSKAVGESVQKPIKYYRNNLDSTLTLLETMSRYGCKRFVFSSSATVYGGENPMPLTEESKVGGCTNPYGRTKYFIEEILRDASAADPTLSVVLLRYFNPIGAHESALIGERPNGIPNNLMPYITQTAAGIREKLSVFGNDYPTADGTGVRDYIHVVDLARGHVAALRYARGHAGTETFNLGTGKGTSVLELVHAFERATGVRVPYEIAPRRPGDIAECYADAGKARRILGWYAEKSVEDMCRDAWRWQCRCEENERPQDER